jgi:hypothetical protein
MAQNGMDGQKTVEAITHEEARRRNIPTVEFQSVMQKEEENPVRVAYARGAAGLEEEKDGRNRDLDPQLVWRGKDEQDWSNIVIKSIVEPMGKTDYECIFYKCLYSFQRIQRCFAREVPE